MFVDDERPKKPREHEIGMDLSALSIEELEDRIALLKAEISRLEADIRSKGTTRQAAESLFSKT